MKTGFNRDYWERLERFVRNLAKRDESAEVFVVSGPLWIPTLKREVLSSSGAVVEPSKEADSEQALEAKDQIAPSELCVNV